MNLFEVKWEQEGNIVKAPGVSEVSLKLCSHFYVSNDLQSVWDAIADIRNDPERRLISITDHSVGVTVIPSPVTQEVPHE